MRGEEFAGLDAGAPFAAEPCNARALCVYDAEAWAEIGHLAIDGHAGPELADEERRLPAATAAERAGPVQIVPLRLVFAVAVEHLYAVVLAVGDIDIAVGVGRDVVHDVELAGIAARLAPAPDQFAVGRELVHAGIAVAVGDIDLALRRQRGVGAAVERLAAHEGCRLL